MHMCLMSEFVTGQIDRLYNIIKFRVLLASYPERTVPNMPLGKGERDMPRRKNRKVVKMKRRNSYLMGVLLCLFAIYLVVLFVQSLTREHVSIYEVNQKQIADNEHLRGIILRNEEVVTAKKSGYANYYVGEGARLSATTTVYSIDADGTAVEKASAVDTTNMTLSEEDTRNVRGAISNFRNNFNLSDYSSIINFRYNIENTLLELSDVNLAKNLSKMKKVSGSSASFELVKAGKTGIISFCSDGLEDLTVDKIAPEHFKEMKDGWKQLRAGGSIDSGDAVYRLVESERWSLVVSLSQEQFVKLAETETIPVKIKKDENVLRATVRTFTSNGKYYANLLFDKYMIHYLNNRYLDIEIQFDSAEGLKIPVSSIVKKKCYVIPEEYITEGDGKTTSGKKGVAVITYTKSGEEQLDFVPAEIYWKDEKNNVYIDSALFAQGSTIMNAQDSVSSRMQVTNVAEIEGVYNCNQGYCRFQYIHKLYENKEYAIVEKGNRYSLSNFDHIVLNPEIIGEDDIIY